MKGDKNVVWKGPIITAIYKILLKRRKKNPTIVTLKIHDTNRERLYMFR